MSLRSVAVSHRFGGHEVLRDVSFSLAADGCTALVGPNGAGKTTWLRIATGYLKPDAGACYWEDQRLDRMSPVAQARSGIARTFQENRLAWTATASENLVMACQGHEWDRLDHVLIRRREMAQIEAGWGERAREVLDLLELSHERETPARNLSYGQAKLLALGTVIVRDPRLVFLDEPVAGVQPRARRKIADVIQRLVALGVRVILIEHDIPFVRDVAHETVFLANGSVVSCGDTDSVLSEGNVRDAFLA